MQILGKTWLNLRIDLFLEFLTDKLAVGAHYFQLFME
jgi:chloramphenicol 3-O-phosphotransferase